MTKKPIRPALEAEMRRMFASLTPTNFVISSRDYAQIKHYAKRFGYEIEVVGVKAGYEVRLRKHDPAL